MTALRRLGIALILLLLVFLPLSAATKVTDFTDSFDRADAANLGANWTSGYTSADAIKISSNVAIGTTNATDAVETVNSFSASNDQWGQVTVSSFTSDTSVAEIAILLRYGAGAAQTGYECAIRQNSAFSTRCGYRIGAALQAGSVSENGVTWTAGDVFYAEVVGTTVNAYRNGTSLSIAFTDANVASGRVGLRIHPSSVGALTSWAGNDFTAGHFSNGSGHSFGLLGAGR